MNIDCYKKTIIPYYIIHSCLLVTKPIFILYSYVYTNYTRFSDYIPLRTYPVRRYPDTSQQDKL